MTARQMALMAQFRSWCDGNGYTIERCEPVSKGNGVSVQWQTPDGTQFRSTTSIFPSGAEYGITEQYDAASDTWQRRQRNDPR